MPQSYTDDDLRQAVAECVNYSEVVRNLGLREHHGNRQWVARRAKELGMDLSHFTFLRRYKSGAGSRGGRPLNEFLVVNGPYISSSNLKKRLVAARFLQPVCSAPGCCVEEQWLGKLLVLQLDHINGNTRDNRLKNLRLLCPNCHTQTATWGRRNGYRHVTTLCPSCKEEMSRCSKLCRSCANQAKKRSSQQNRTTKIVWPAIAKLEKMVAGSSYSAVGRKLGVSDNAVRKRIRSHS